MSNSDKVAAPAAWSQRLLSPMQPLTANATTRMPRSTSSGKAVLSRSA
jgi:hypothetical protein